MHGMRYAFFCSVLVMLMMLSSPSFALAETVELSFSGLQTNLSYCGGTQIGEEVTDQFQPQGIVFSVNEFGLAHGYAESNSEITPTNIALNTIDENGCPIGRYENYGVLTATFVDPIYNTPIAIGNFVGYIQDSERSVKLEAFNSSSSEPVLSCTNVFSGCSFASTTSNYYVTKVEFPGSVEITRIDFIDESPAGRSDGFVIDNFSFDVNVGTCSNTETVDFNGLNASDHTCTNSKGQQQTVGEAISDQYVDQGVLFTPNEYGIVSAYSYTDPTPSGPTHLALNTIDNATNQCPEKKNQDNGILTVSFLDPVSLTNTSASEIILFVEDTERNVKMQAFDSSGGNISCDNVFSGCTYSSFPYSTNRVIKLTLPGTTDFDTLVFTDTDAVGHADGFAIDDLSFKLYGCYTDYSAQ